MSMPCNEPFHKLPAEGGVVEVAHGQSYLARIGVHGIPEENRLKQGHHEQHYLHPGVPEDVDEFLFHHHVDSRDGDGRPHLRLAPKLSLKRARVRRRTRSANATRKSASE
jgi:hypothetical protein